MGTGRRQKRRRKVRRKRRMPVCFLLFLLILVTAGVFVGYQTGDLLPVISSLSGNAPLTDGKANVPQKEPDISESEVEDGFYFQQLDEKEQLIYRELLQGVRDEEETILLSAGKEEDTGKIYEYLMYDRPELFWCDGSSQMTVYEDETEFRPSYTCTKEQKEARQTEIEEAAQQIIGSIPEDATEYEKIKAVFEYLVNTVDYDEDASDNQNIYSALIGKKSVCAGYSRAAQYLLNQLGIPCIYVTGSAAGQTAHAWNIVQCDGKYYQMDVTFGDPVFQESETGETLPHDIINYEYLCCTDEELFADHNQDTSVPYPVCDSDDLNYYKLNDLYYTSYDADQIFDKMKEGIGSGQEMFTVRFSDETVFEAAKEGILSDLVPKAASLIAEQRQLKEVRYTYAVDAQKQIVMVFWNYGA